MIKNLKPSQTLVLSFLLLIIIGSILLNTPWAVAKGQPNYIEALFTATSAVCVTGLVVVDTGTHWSLFGQIVIMLLFQIGGLGVMTLVTFFIFTASGKMSLKEKLLIQQSISKPALGNVTNVFKHIVFFTFILEFIGAGVLFIYWLPSMGAGQALWYSIFHSISAFNNAGFDLFGNFSSLTSFTEDILVNIVISVLFIFGALGFIVIYEISNYHKLRQFSFHSKVVLVSTGFLIITGAIIIFLFEYNNSLSQFTIAGKILASYFQSCTRTAGFSTVDISSTLLSTQLVLMFLMFVGGSPGSTAGGIKVTTFSVLAGTVHSILKGKKEVEIFNRRIESDNVFKAFTIFALTAFLVLLFSIVISLTNNFAFNEILFEVISATCTVGLSLGITSDLNTAGRLVLIVAMFLGRIGMITVGYVLLNRTSINGIRLPKENIMVA